MQISASDIGKRFNRDWIFRKFSGEFAAGNSYAITGPNGSGKSTLLQLIGGAIAESEGKIDYTIDGKMISADNAFRYISIAAPYQEVIEELTVTEFLRFHSTFKPLSVPIKEIIQTVGLVAAANKQIRYYSSGMKQRVKLAQAIFSTTPCVLLDEPCTNLDAAGIALYQQLIEKYCNNRLVVVSSNDIQEYGFCREKIDIMSYKSTAGSRSVN